MGQLKTAAVFSLATPANLVKNSAIVTLQHGVQSEWVLVSLLKLKLENEGKQIWALMRW